MRLPANHTHLIAVFVIVAALIILRARLGW